MREHEQETAMHMPESDCDQSDDIDCGHSTEKRWGMGADNELTMESGGDEEDKFVGKSITPIEETDRTGTALAEDSMAHEVNNTVAYENAIKAEETDYLEADHLQNSDSGRRQQQHDKKNHKKTHGKARRTIRKHSVLDDLLSLVIRLLVIVAVVWAIFTYVFGIFVNSGVGMEPSVQDRDIIVFYRLDNTYNANEAVVYEADGQERLGRIVAKGGDIVDITDEGLKVNGYLQQDYKNIGETLAVTGGPDYPVQLAEDEFFILGDNREKSTDSRMFGPVNIHDIRGSVMSVLRRRDI